MGKKDLIRKQKALHQEAVAAEELWYTDPESGKKVLTAFFLVKRGYCCSSFCRHCPYGFDGERIPTVEELDD